MPIRRGFISALLLTAACAVSPRYNFTVDEETLDASGATGPSRYAFAADNPDGAIADQEIRAALDKELGARGWTATARGDADVLVGYALEEEAGSTEVTDAFLGPFSTVNADATRELHYLNRTLVISLTSGATGEDVWRGWAAARFFTAPGDARTAMIDQAVGSIIAQLDD